MIFIPIGIIALFVLGWAISGFWPGACGEAVHPEERDPAAGLRLNNEATK